jgi:hypothetical protein
MESGCGGGLGVRELVGPHHGKGLHPLQEALEVFRMPVLAMEDRMVRIIEFEGEPQEPFENIRR